MVEKYDLVEVLREVLALLKGLDPSEQRQIMALVAERNGMTLVDKTASRGSSYRPAPGRKSKPY